MTSADDSDERRRNQISRCSPLLAGESAARPSNYTRHTRLRRANKENNSPHSPHFARRALFLARRCESDESSSRATRRARAAGQQRQLIISRTSSSTSRELYLSISFAGGAGASWRAGRRSLSGRQPASLIKVRRRERSKIGIGARASERTAAPESLCLSWAKIDGSARLRPRPPGGRARARRPHRELAKISPHRGSFRPAHSRRRERRRKASWHCASRRSRPLIKPRARERLAKRLPFICRCGSSGRILMSRKPASSCRREAPALGWTRLLPGSVCPSFGPFVRLSVRPPEESVRQRVLHGAAARGGKLA